MICPKCKGRGKRTEFYSEVMEASGTFYDRDVIREIRTITIKCKPCNGTGEVADIMKEN